MESRLPPMRKLLRRLRSRLATLIAPAELKKAEPEVTAFRDRVEKPAHRVLNEWLRCPVCNMELGRPEETIRPEWDLVCRCGARVPRALVVRSSRTPKPYETVIN